MREKPTDIYAMLRQALVARIDLGDDEMILTPRPAGWSSPAARGDGAEQVQTETASIVSVEEAVLGEGKASETSQAGLGLYQEPSYGSLDEHRAAICECQECPLGQTRNKFVYGVGNPNAGVMFIGEAPGADEDRLGEPFVGRAGQLLDKILAAIELSRDDVYIGNILKCRPPANRDPNPDEMAKCFPYLREQVRLIRPKLICALGRIAGQALLKTSTPLGKLRGRWHEYEGVPLMLTYHPAALLRFPGYKRDTWEDMKMLKARYDQLTA